MEELIDRLVTNSERLEQATGLYDVPEIYDLFYLEKFGYEQRFETIDEFEPRNTSRVAVLACGTGEMVRKLEDEYETVVGYDVDSDMLELAEEKVDSRLVEVDLSEPQSFDEKFDLVFMLGNAMGHFHPADARTLFENAYRLLGEGGRFFFDYIPQSEAREKSREEKREYDAIEIIRWSTSTWKANSQTTLDVRMEYEITLDGDVFEFTHEIEMETFTSPWLMKSLEDAGFVDVHPSSVGVDNNGLFVGTRS